MIEDEERGRSRDAAYFGGVEVELQMVYTYKYR